MDLMRRILTFVGGVLYPIILNRLIPQIGYAWAVRVIGFICLATLVVPNLIMKVRVLPPAKRKLIDMTAFRHPAYLVFVLGSFLSFQGLFIPFFYMQFYAIDKHITNDNLAFYLLSILNSASVFGRIVPNLFADKLGMATHSRCQRLMSLLTFNQGL
jgi:predicted MFS family arabinose efflux permease